MVPRSMEQAVEGACVVKHTFHIPHIVYVPIIERLVEGDGAKKHGVHTLHTGNVPIIERLVEAREKFFMIFVRRKHITHIRHTGNVPIANLAVFFHNVLLPSSAGKIIFNGATQSSVGKGRDEQRVSFSNLLDDIGGQLLQSSEEFLLGQLRQPSSRDATAHLFGVASTRRALLS